MALLTLKAADPCPRQTQLEQHNFLRVQLQPNTQSLVFSWVCTITPFMSVCIFLVILAPVCSPAHYLLQLFQGSDFFYFFFYSVMNVFSNVAKYNSQLQTKYT